ncbi:MULTISPECIES: DUF6543 domain-containing protein [Pseudomonas]|uniref:dermonecrotic toxin domain-containing protein n=1 Tax=Pseudomonas TaxID=286 RepID=UPI001C2F4321|nr:MULTISPECIES: DUF6543 domain-containing protein [Pseudomonas]MBV2080117.1 hypothetical protein [Pseudomonas carnis]MBV2085875.1 hypothetical protein [Pseudomonas carnis]MDO3690063.1 hypothetical protein [Pseudomonas sp. DKN 2791]MDO7032771.1 hypothetical protein [Pseudomonas sp. DKN 2792]
MSTDTTAWADKLDFDDPGTSPLERDEAIRALLTRRLNAVAHPSHEINQIQQAQVRGRESAKALSGLIGRAPRILGVIRGALREAFSLDPDTLLFTEPLPPAPARKVNSLTERALALLVQPNVPLNINQFTSLSLKDEPTKRLAFTARQALVRVKDLALLALLERAVAEYWQQLAYGSWLTRRERWVQLRTSLFAENAFLAHRTSQLTDSGYDMVSKLLQIPDGGLRQQAGGEWAAIQVSHIMWPGTNRAMVPIPGAMHIYRDGVVGATPQVIYLPGLFREFYEFDSFNQLQCDLPLLVNGPLSSVLWQCLPLRRRHEACNTIGATPMTFVRQHGDALRTSASELLDGQWDNELACALSINHGVMGIQDAGQPAIAGTQRFLRFIQKGRLRLVAFTRLGRTLDALLEWDYKRRSDEIVLGRLTPDLAFKTQEAQLQRYEKKLMGLLDNTDVGIASTAYQEFLSLERQWQDQVAVARKWSQGPLERVFQKAYWLEQPEGSRSRGSLVAQAQRGALLGEAQMQHRLSLMSRAHLDCLDAVLNEAWVPGANATDSCVLQVSVGCEATKSYSLLGAVVVTTQAARTQPAALHPVVLCVMGQHGGLVAFDSLNAFVQGLQASLKSRDSSVLWRCVERHRREALRTAISLLPEATPLVVSYIAIERYVLKDLFIKQAQHHIALNKRIDKGERLFSEVSDPQLSRMLLARDLFECLQVPDNDARTLALANIDLLQAAATQAKKLPPWLGIASSAQRKHYKRLLRRYLVSIFALETKLWQDLPDLEPFARKALIAKLTEGGFYPQLDIETPLFDMPDDVSTHYDGWTSQGAVGDRQIKTVVSKERTTFSMLQLALHNLDPEAPWTRWRLNRARWLDPTWKERLSVSYLIKMIASLDVGGEYDKLIRRAFYPSPGSSFGLSQALIDRGFKQRAEMQLYSAVRQGLNDWGQRLFTFAMAARKAGDLKNDEFEVQLAVLRLVGVTLEYDRHIAGILVIHDKPTGKCVVYWPTAVASRVLVGYASLAEAEQALNRLGALPANLKEVARLVAPGWEHQAVQDYPDESLGVEPRLPYSEQLPPGGVRLVAVLVEFFLLKHKVPAAGLEAVEAQIKEQIALQPERWLEVVATSHSNPTALLAHARVFELQRRTQARSNSSQALEEYRERRLGEQFEATIRGLLAFIPVLGVGISVYEMLLAARRFHFNGSDHDAVDVVALTLFAFIDVLSTFAPGPKGARVARAALPRYKGNTVALTGLKAPSAKPTHLLARFKSTDALEGAVELKGPASKTQYVKNGQQLLADGGDLYTVYQRKAESVVRFKESQNELVLNIHQPPEWLLGADAPQPGPSSGVLNPWRVQVEPLRDWYPPVVRAATENRIVRSSMVATHWFDWRVQVQATQLSDSAIPGVYHVQLDTPGAFYNAIYVGARYDTQAGGSGVGYYRLLDSGDQAPLTDIAFVTRDTQSVLLARTQIERWASTAMSDQPIPVSRTATGEWLFHAPLFDRPLEYYVHTAFSSMTSASREFAVARLIELSGPPQLATASHLLNIRATLDDWLTSVQGRRGQTDDLLQLLRVNERRNQYLYVGYEGKAPGFTRVDFTPPHPLNPDLQFGVTPVRTQRLDAERAAVRTVLEQQGFTVQDLSVRRPGGRAGEPSHESVVTHPHSNKIYYVAYQWLEHGRMTVRTKLTDKWIRVAIKAHPNSLLLMAVHSAMQEQRLVRIVAGIQWATKGNLNPTVYFVKLKP